MFKLDKEIKDLFFFSLKFALLVLIVTNFFFRINIVYGKSMEPSLLSGTRILTNLIQYRFKDPKRFDLVIIKRPYDKEKQIIKRVIAFEGETVQISGGKLYINNIYTPQNFPHIKILENFGPCAINKNNIFVIGDNRPDSEDSRSFGGVSKDLITGKPCAKLWPPGAIK